MPSRSLSGQMYDVTAPSMPQRVVLAASLACCAVLTWWLLFFGGAAIAGSWFGRHWAIAGFVRRAGLALALSIYFVRVLLTTFVFLKRGISWAEVFTIAPWVLCIYGLLALAGSVNPAPFAAAAIGGAGLFVLGSWMNSFAERQRHAWKQRPENHGKLYTRGLFRLSRHPNYLGDLIAFSGLCLMTGCWFTAIIPVLMLCGFVFVNVPALDTHLAAHYGPAFDEYARKTRKLIPFIY